ENAKRFAGFFLFPELNHHLVEGLSYPKTNSSRLVFVLFESALYDLRVQKRYEITKKIFDKNNIKYLEYKCQEKDKIAQVCELLVLSGYLSFYSAMVEGIDPTAIPNVDFLKDNLKQ
ncbi:hypothetical protein KKA13_02935, partial [Patescibacteria group bacterium]|nr:hypothetical protein [Patescibacteria group bacterium]